MKKIILSVMVVVCTMALCAADLTGVKIYINPGHGGYNSNDRSVATIPFPQSYVDSTGFWESSSNLTKGLYLRDLLQAAGATVYMSRTDNRSGSQDDAAFDASVGDRSLTAIAAEASANNVDAFLSIHSNAAGVTTAVNYLYLMCPGKGGEGDQNFRDTQTEKLAKACWPYMWDNSINVWTHYTATNTKILCYVTSYSVIGSSLTVPGFLSEGSFHDYKPETHRLLNIDYRKLEAYRFFYFYCNFFGADQPAKGILCGDVRNSHERMTNSLYLPYISGSKDQWAPMNGAKVTLCNNSGDSLDTYTVDNYYNGVYVFYNLEPGNYKLKFNADSYTEQIADVKVIAGKNVVHNVLMVDTTYVPEVVHSVCPDYPDPVQDGIAEVPSAFKMTEQSKKETPFLNTLNIRRAIIKGEKMYVLTNDSRIFTVNAVTGDSIAELSTEGVSGGTVLLSDIAFTSDTVLLACNKDIIPLTAPTTYFKIYKWTNDTAAPKLVFKSQKQANWSNGEVGTTMAVSGPSWHFKVYVTAITTGSSRAVRLIGLEYDEDENMITTEKYMMDAANYTEPLWGKNMQFTISPRGDNRFIVDSEVMQPTEYEYDWTAADRSTMIDCGSMPVSAIPVLSYGANYFKYAKHSLMSVPVCTADTANVSVALFDITDGLDKAVQIAVKQPEAGLGTAKSLYMMAAAKVNGYDIALTVLGQNEGLGVYKTITTDVLANIYASELKLTETADNYEFGFTLNEKADAVEIQFVVADEVVGTYDAGSKTKGVQKVVIPKTSLPSHTSMNWQVKATAASTIRPQKISNDSEVFQFYNTFGVAIDKNTESPYFGRVYVTSSKSGTCAGTGARTTSQGLYVLDAALTDITHQGAAAYSGGVSWHTNNSPYRLTVAPDGRIFLCDFSDVHSGIWIANPAKLTDNFTEFFAGLTRADNGLSSKGTTVVHGSISSCYVTGEGENTILYTTDEDYLVNAGSPNVLQYNIGTATTWNEAPSAVVFERATHKLLVNKNNKIVPDGRGGWWISQYRAAETLAEPCLLHFNGTDVDFHTGTGLLIGNGRNGALAVTEDGKRLATTGPSEINIWDVSYNASGVPSLTKVLKINNTLIGSGLGASSNDVAFDPAGNIYYISNSSERLVMVALPKGDNSYVTAAPASQKVMGVGMNIPVTEQRAKIYAKDGLLIVEAETTEQVRVYNIAGQLLVNEKINAGVNTFQLKENQVVVVKIGDCVEKIIM